MIFFQIGCGNSANYAGLVEGSWATHFDLPGIPADTSWHGVLVDLQPASILEMMRKFGDSSRLDIVNVAVAGKAGFFQMEKRDLLEIDLEARLLPAGNYNDKVRDFKSGFFCHTITLDQLFGFAGDAEIGLLALDVQGSEVDILTHYSWRIRPRLIDVEPHSEEAEKIVSDILTQQGYTFVRRRPDGRRRVNHLWRDDEDTSYGA